MKSTSTRILALSAVGVFTCLANAVSPFVPPPQVLRALPKLAIDQGDDKLAWIEDFNHPDNTRMWTNLAGNQSQTGWFNRPQDIVDWPNDSGYMAVFDNRFYMTGLSEDQLGAPAAHLLDTLLTDLGFGDGSGTTQCSVSFDVCFGDGDWFFAGDLGAGNPGPGEQVGFFDFAIETFNSGGTPLALRPRLICRPGLSFAFNGDNGSGTTSVSTFQIQNTLRKTLNSADPDDHVRIMLTYDGENGHLLEAYVDCVGFLNSAMDDFGGLAGFEDMSRVEIQTGTFLEAGLPGDPFIGKFNYDNLVVTNYVATPGDVVNLIGAIGRDIDGDGDLDAQDGVAITGCLAEPDELVNPAGCDSDDFAASDHDCDGDADVRDYARLQPLVRP